MPTEIHHDIVIVGAGPAGATAAYLLKRHGFDVLLVDKSIFPRRKLCGGLLTTKTLTLLQRIYGDSREDLQRKQIIDYSSHQYEVRTKDHLLSRGDSLLPFVFVDRLTYDNYLLNHAKLIGVAVLEGEKIVRADLSNRQVLTSSGKIIQGKYILGADGVNSIVRSSFPESCINQTHWKANLAMAVEVFVSREDVEVDITCPILYYGIIDWGYAWIFPNQDKLIVGAGGLINHNERMTTSIQNVLRLIGYKCNEQINTRGHPVPYGNFINAPAYGQIILLGDAAGFVDPITGEGIYYAQRSGELAAQAIQAVENRKGQLADIYSGFIKEHIIPELSYGKKVRDQLFRLAAVVGYQPLKLFFRILGSQALEAVHGNRSYKWLKKKGDSDERK